jgi:acetylornithine deacetylase
LNIIPNLCEFKFELRNLKSDSPEEIIEQLRQAASDIVDKYSHEFPGAGIEIEIFNAYPALDTAPQEEVVEYVRSLADGNQPVKIDFGTEGGLFQHRLKVPTVVCGPGSMDQGHKPDEFIEQSQLLKCDAFLGRLLERLCVKGGA